MSLSVAFYIFLEFGISDNFSVPLYSFIFTYSDTSRLHLCVTPHCLILPPGLLFAVKSSVISSK